MSGRSRKSSSRKSRTSRTSNYTAVSQTDDVAGFDPFMLATKSAQAGGGIPIAYGVQAGPGVVVSSQPAQISNATPAAMGSSMHAASSPGVVFAVREPPRPCSAASSRVRGMAILSLVLVCLSNLLNVVAWSLFGVSSWSFPGTLLVGLLFFGLELPGPVLNLASVSRAAVHGRRAICWVSFGFHVVTTVALSVQLGIWTGMDTARCSGGDSYFSSQRNLWCAGTALGNFATLFQYVGVALGWGVLMREFARKRSMLTINAVLARPINQAPSQHRSMMIASWVLAVLAWVVFALSMMLEQASRSRRDIYILTFMFIMVGGLVLTPQIAVHNSLKTTHNHSRCCNWSVLALSFGTFILATYAACFLTGLTFLFISFYFPLGLGFGLLISGLLGILANSFTLHVAGKELRRTKGGCCCNSDNKNCC